LIALLYLVTEELLVEAHEVPDRPWVTATFFAGFLVLLLLEETIG
jgi:ZIP family zinc transporter